MTTTAGRMVHDELDGVVSELCARFPTRPRSEIESVVADVYAELASNAEVVAHLIPLTLNRSRRRLHDTPTWSTVPDAGVPTARRG